MEKNYIGKRLDDRYEIVSLVGVGGMSNVYKAIDTKTSAVVAIKVLKQEFFENEELVRRFKNESKAISLLNNPNIIKVLDVNITDEEKYIVVEYIDGITLKEYIESRKVLTWQETVQFTGTILSAMGHAHDNGIIHRDLKPQNIMLLRDGNIKIMDFGIARLSMANQKTVTDKAIGSVHYISPEQVRGKNTDSRSDIYSIGIMMYEMLTGTLPFRSETAVSVAMQQLSDIAKRPSEIVDSIPQGLEQIVMKAISKEANKRYQTAGEMLKDLNEFKTNPAIIFDYAQENEQTQTVMVNKVASKKPTKKVNVKRGFRMTLPVLAGVAAAFAVSAVVCIVMIFSLNGYSLFTNQQDVELPNFVGMTEQQVNDAGYKFKYSFEYVYSADHPEGVVFSQAPKPPKTVKEKGSIKLKVSKGTQTSQLPDLSNYTRSEAEKILTELGVNLTIVPIEDKKMASGRVVKTDPEKGAIISSGSTVTLYIASNKSEEQLNKKIVPNVVGLSSLDDAKKVLGVNGLNVGSYTSRADGAPAGTVIEQSPVSGEEVIAGSRVTLVISSGPPTCPVCGATDHTEHPKCEICGSTEHIKDNHVCEICGEKAHGKESCPHKCPIHGSAHTWAKCPDNPANKPSPTPVPTPPPTPVPTPAPTQPPVEPTAPATT